jgi:hypothetical protein
LLPAAAKMRSAFAVAISSGATLAPLESSVSIAL